MSDINLDSYCDECGGECDGVHATATRIQVNVLQGLKIGDVYKMLINAYNNTELDKLASLLVYHLAEQ